MNSQTNVNNLSCPLCSGKETAFFFSDTKNFQHRYHHCTDCDLVFVHPDCRLSRKAEKARYDMHENHPDAGYIDFLSRLAIPLCTQLSEPASGLDFGSGKTPVMADLFRQKGHSCVCYDSYFYPDTKLLQTQYDFIIASEVIEHLYNPQIVFEQWLSLLKPQGTLGIMTGIRPHAKDFPNWWYKNDPTHVVLFSIRTFEFLKKRYGLETCYQSGNVFLFKRQVIN